MCCYASICTISFGANMSFYLFIYLFLVLSSSLCIFFFFFFFFFFCCCICISSVNAQAGLYDMNFTLLYFTLLYFNNVIGTSHCTLPVERDAGQTPLNWNCPAEIGTIGNSGEPLHCTSVECPWLTFCTSMECLGVEQLYIS